jgi:hypothetical protein
MSLASRLVQAGFSAIQAAAIQGTSQTGLTATGTVQGTAFAVPADINKFTTVAAGTGAILPAMNPGDSLVVVNGGANALLLYPPVGATINALGANTAYSVATATPTCEVYCVSPLIYHAFQSA